MVDRRKSRVQFISPLEEEEDLKSIKLTPKNALTQTRSAVARFTFDGNDEFDHLSPSESGLEKSPCSLVRRNSEGQLNKAGGWFKRSCSGGKNPQ